MINLTNKNIFFICPAYFDYQKDIIKVLEKAGANITYREEKPGVLTNILKNISRKIYLDFIESYKKKIIRELQTNKYDLLFVIRGYYLDTDFYKEIRKKNPNIKLLMYQWDSLENNNNDILNSLSLFDMTFSFDKKDCNNVEKLNYLPLFFVNDFENIRKVKNTEKFDFVFIGSHQFQRAIDLNRVKKYCENNNLTFFCFQYINFFAFIKYLFKGIYIKDVSFKKLSRKGVIKIFKQASGIIDIQNMHQTGLTIRTFEVLASGLDLYTTNVNLLNEEIVSNKIHVFDVNDIDIRINSLDICDAGFIDKYNLTKWVETLINSVI